MVWYSNGGLKTGLKIACLWYKIVHYSNVLPSQVTLPLENGTPILSGIQMNLVISVYGDLQAHVQLHTKAHMRYTKTNDKRKTSQAKP